MFHLTGRYLSIAHRVCMCSNVSNVSESIIKLKQNKTTKKENNIDFALTMRGSKNEKHKLKYQEI